MRNLGQIEKKSSHAGSPTHIGGAKNTGMREIGFHLLKEPGISTFDSKASSVVKGEWAERLIIDDKL